MDLETLMSDMLISEDSGDFIKELFQATISLKLKCLLPFQRNSKNDEISVFFKEEGDCCLKGLRHQDAVQAYTNALRMAIPNSDTEAACYRSRAIALLRIRAYEDCSLDVERALQLSPSEGKRGEFLQMQKRLSELKATGRRGKGNGAGQKERPDKDVATMSYGENPEVPGATDAIKLAYDKRFGRHFVAEKPISAGDLLLVQTPYFVFPAEEKELRYCHYCLKPTLALIPCESCTDTLYCSPECRSTAYEKYHRIECKFSGASREFKIIIRFFLIVTNQSATLREAMNLLERKSKADTDPRTLGFVNNQFNGHTAEAMLSLIDHADDGFNLEFLTTAIMVKVLLQAETDVFTGYDNEETLDFIYRLTCLFHRNLVMIRDKHLTSISAEALYPVFNILNHSCVTNTIWYTTVTNQRVLLASKDIKPGEHIFSNYLSQNILVLSAKERKMQLSLGKFFVCECEACSTDYTFKQEIKRLKIPMNVQRQLRKDPISVDCIWQVLKCMQREQKSPCAEIETMKFVLMEAYMNATHPMAMSLYKSLGIFENSPPRR